VGLVRQERTAADVVAGFKDARALLTRRFDSPPA
jgi:hypothetical protein